MWTALAQLPRHIYNAIACRKILKGIVVDYSGHQTVMAHAHESLKWRISKVVSYSSAEFALRQLLLLFSKLGQTCDQTACGDTDTILLKHSSGVLCINLMPGAIKIGINLYCGQTWAKLFWHGMDVTAYNITSKLFSAVGIVAGTGNTIFIGY